MLCRVVVASARAMTQDSSNDKALGILVGVRESQKIVDRLFKLPLVITGKLKETLQ
jgi:hypothetical protein